MDTSQKTVIVLDDNEAVVQAVALHVRMLGHIPRVTTDPDEALSWVREADMAVVDVLMPRQNGVAWTQQARQVLPGFPVVLMTGWRGYPGVEHVLQTVSDPVLEKPFSHDLLVAAIATVMNRVCHGT
jgi:DNA-binding NtrC family response regulator